MSFELLPGDKGVFSELERFLHPTVVTQTFAINPFELLCAGNILAQGTFMSDDPTFFSMSESSAAERLTEVIGNASLARILIDEFSHERPERVLHQVVIKKRLVNESIPLEIFLRCVSRENAIPRHVLIALLSELKPMKQDSSHPLSLRGGENVLPLVRNDGRVGRCLVASNKVVSGTGKWTVMLDKADEKVAHIPAGSTLILRSRLASSHLCMTPWF